LFTNFREILFIAFEFRLAVPSTFVTVRAEKPGADRNSTHKTKKTFTPKRLNNQKSRTQLSSVDVVKPDTKTRKDTSIASRQTHAFTRITSSRQDNSQLPRTQTELSFTTRWHFKAQLFAPTARFY
jgi:hypothetical protein